MLKYTTLPFQNEMAIQSQDHVSAADKEYKLPRDGRESIRLTAQHYMVVNRQGWILHPDVESAIKDIPNPKIIDLATGTGIWASDIAQRTSACFCNWTGHLEGTISCCSNLTSKLEIRGV